MCFAKVEEGEEVDSEEVGEEVSKLLLLVLSRHLHTHNTFMYLHTHNTCMHMRTHVHTHTCTHTGFSRGGRGFGRGFRGGR